MVFIVQKTLGALAVGAFKEAQVYFRLESHVDMDIEGSGGLKLSYGGANSITVSFKQEVEEYYFGELEDNYYFFEVTAQGTWNPAKRHVMLFQDFSIGQIPHDWDASAPWVTAERESHGRISRSMRVGHEPGYVPRLAALPSDLQGLLASIKDELDKHSRNAVNLVRWRLGVGGSHQPLRQSLYQWSLNGTQWFVVPFNSEPITLDLSPSPAFEPAIQAEFQYLVTNDHGEPLGHSLWREAWEQRIRNPRSALVIGVAAAEVEFKGFATKSAPSLGWLIGKKPLIQLLNKYLPELLKNQEDFKYGALPKAELLDPLEKAIDTRNIIIHASPTTSTKYQQATERLETHLKSDLLAARDLLWFLDYYRGNSWALEHVRRDTREAWEELP